MYCLSCGHYSNADSEMRRAQNSTHCLCACHPWNHHQRYEHGDRRRMFAIVNDGHNGSMLNCTHPACVAIRANNTAIIARALGQ